jgi:muramoyltetrapeptide carboxypeptidase
MTEGKPRRPRALRPRALGAGGAVGVCAPGGPIEADALAPGLGWLESQGVDARCGPNLHRREGYLAGSDDERADDLLALVRDPEIDAILFARGGYGVGRLLPRLDPAVFAESRKLFIGYSDFTVFALWLQARAGLASIHGPMLERAGVSEQARARLIALARGEPVEPLEGKSMAPGRARGRLVGGNLRMITTTLGTPWEIDTDGAILFIEEVGEQPYAIDRSFVQLRDAGKLEAAAGVAIGRLVGCDSQRYPEVSACDVLERALLPEVRGPVVQGLPFGHVDDNRALGVGVEAELDGESGRLTLLEPVVDTEVGDAD